MFWRDKKVFLTGHTGFKGSWLSLWLQMLGVQLTGYALAPPTTPSLFQSADVSFGMRSITGDVSDLAHLTRAMTECKPEIVFHLAAQSLVRVSYRDPVLTFLTNVMGTVNLLEAVRHTPSVSAVVVVTSDKCYENHNCESGYREDDRLGGHDPYSNSKACAELVSDAYRSSFFQTDRQRFIRLATARAGNVIGGGDWAQDRLLPDIVKCFSEGSVLKVRNPQAIRPWQHVFEPLRGYLMLAQQLYQDGAAFTGAWNFGPDAQDAQSVRSIVETVAAGWGTSVSWQVDGEQHPYEAAMLHLDCSKAAQQLEWRPLLRLNEALSLTLDWYRHFLSGKRARDKCMEQLSAYCTKFVCGDLCDNSGLQRPSRTASP